MVIYPFVTTRVSLFWGSTQPGRLPNESAIEIPPPRHKSLVIKACWKQRSQKTVNGAQIKSCARPTVDTPRLKPLLEGNLRCPEIWLIPITHQLHKRVGLFRSTRENAARPVIFETPSNNQDIIGDERGSESVPLIPLITLPVEHEAQGTLPIDHSPIRESRHFDDSSTGVISCVTVSRSI